MVGQQGAEVFALHFIIIDHDYLFYTLQGTGSSPTEISQRGVLLGDLGFLSSHVAQEYKRKFRAIAGVSNKRTI
jgi:hypothetical protein